MASIGKDRNGRKRILFVAEDGSRKTIRLGKATLRQAEAFKARLENLIAGRYAGGLDDEVARWLANLPDDLYGRLVSVGLAEAREHKKVTLMGPFIDAYLASRTDVKERTRSVYDQTRRNLVTFFGDDKPVADLTAYDGEQWSRYLAVDQKLAEATARKRTQVAKQFLQSAVKQGLIRTNPFSELKSSAVGNPSRQYFVTEAESRKLLSACPDCQWRLLFCLARYGGVRVPTEALALRWQDVNWEQSRILIHSRKTERHEGKGTRWIPLFPELLTPLQECFDRAEPGDVYCVTRYRDRATNLRTQLGRIAKRAGLTLWPKPWQNCRATRATELSEEYPAHVVASWLGHSEKIAERHYLQTTEEHFRRAAHNPAQHAHESSARSRMEPQRSQYGIGVFRPETPDCGSVLMGTGIPQYAREDSNL